MTVFERLGMKLFRAKAPEVKFTAPMREIAEHVERARDDVAGGSLDLAASRMSMVQEVALAAERALRDEIDRRAGAFKPVEFVGR